jgi:DNA-binding NtrC family response regulator
MDGAALHPIPDHILFGRSETMQEVRRAIEKVSGASVPLLLQGEPGTGKEAIGWEIHRRSPWRMGPFTRMDSTVSAPSPENQTLHPGADHLSFWWTLPANSLGVSPGTLFIEEVADLNPTLQARLLELFQDDAVGHPNDRGYALAVPRVICATRRTLENCVAAGNFREDLFYRINIVSIELPPLRDRKEDVPDLANYFLKLSCRQRDCRYPHITTELLQTLSEYDWPGNIRELKDWVNTYVSLDGNAAMVEALLRKGLPVGRRLRPEPSKHWMPLRAYKRLIGQEAERDMILKVLSEKRWNRKEAAKALQISYQTLLHKLKQTGVSKKQDTGRDVAGKQIAEGRLS